MAFVLAMAGMLLIYGELLGIGRLVCGVSGALLTIYAVNALWQRGATPLGLAMLGGATICFAIEAKYQVFFLAGMVGTALLGVGCWKLYQRPPWISAELAFPGSLLFGAVTTGLCAVGKRAQWNKRKDL